MAASLEFPRANFASERYFLCAWEGNWFSRFSSLDSVGLPSRVLSVPCQSAFAMTRVNRAADNGSLIPSTVEVLSRLVLEFPFCFV